MTVHYPPYISDQPWRVWTAEGWPTDPNTAAANRQDAGQQELPSPWNPVTIQQIRDGCCSTRSGTALSLHNIVIGTDAGMGKTMTIARLRALFSQRGSRVLPVLVTSRLLESGGHGPRDTTEDDRFLSALAEECQTLTHDVGGEIEAKRRMIERLRDTQRLVLLVDRIDHFMGTAAMQRLVHLLNSPVWGLCRWILAGRRYAIEELHTQHDQLFLQPRPLVEGRQRTAAWRCVELLEFTVAQRKRFLGEDRWNQIPSEGQAILSNPRALEYVFNLRNHEGTPEAEFAVLRKLRTGSDVYLRCLRHMIQAAVEKCPPGWKMSRHGNFRQILFLLGAIAFRMTEGEAHKDPQTGEIVHHPNFERVVGDSQMARFKEDVETRYRPAQGITFDDDWKALAELNVVLRHGLLDSGNKLDSIQFQNKSLQEFCCAYYLAQHAFEQNRKGQDISPLAADDRETLQRWWYRPEILSTEVYRDLWRFLSDMPGGDDGTRDDTWLEAIRPLYAVAKPVDGEWQHPLRCTEMIYRSWSRVDALANVGSPPLARYLRDTWRGEFCKILAGDQGSDRQQAAQELVNSFLKIPGGEFIMGSPAEHHAGREELRDVFQDWLDTTLIRRAEEWPAAVTEFLQRGNQDWTPITVADREYTERRDAVFFTALQEATIEPLMTFWYPNDEERHSRIVKDFALSRQTVSNRWYRLFVPAHGRDPHAYFYHNYVKYCEGQDHPVAYVSWYDAWTFATWANWEGGACRLPGEVEWEYAAKFRTPWDWRSWWGANLDDSTARKYANFKGGPGRTTVPSPDHANPETKAIDQNGIGLMDLLGNVWEWCADWYVERVSSPETDPGVSSQGSRRVSRGGSWANNSAHCRSAFRGRYSPGDRISYLGFRVALVPSSK